MQNDSFTSVEAPMASGSFPVAEMWPKATCTALEWQQEDPISPNVKQIRGLVRGPWHTLLSRKKEHTVSLKEGKIFQSNKQSTV